MANLKFNFLVNDKGLKDGVKKSQKSLKGFESTTKKISGSIGKALGGIGLALGVGAIVDQLKQATKAAQDDILSQKMLARQLKITTGATDKSVQSTEDYIASLAMATGVADDELRPALATMLRVTGKLSKAQDLLNLSLDVAAGTGKPLAIVTKSIGRAYLGNVSGLQKLVPGIKKGSDAMAYLRQNFAGARETLADPFTKLKVATDEIQENIGNLLLPTVQKFVDYFNTTLAPALQKFFDDANNPKTETGATFVRIKDLVKKIWDIIVDIGKSESFKKGLSAAITLAMTLLSIVENVASILTDANDKEKAKIGGSLIGGKANSKLLTIANVKLSAKTLGIKNFSTAQAKAAIKDMAGGADHNPQTPWPMANGGIVMPRPGGTLAQIGEAGKPEAVIPLDKFAAFGNSNYTINVNKANMTGEEIIRIIKKFEISSGRKFLYA